jgi:hypothetical protein
MTDVEQTEAPAALEKTPPEREPAQPPVPAPAPAEPPKAVFAPHVEAEEGEPTRFDYVVLALVTALVIGALLWAFGVVTIPGLPI